MNCAEVMELLSDYYDGELELSQNGRMQDHLAGCPVCTARLSEFKQLSAFVSHVPDIQIEPDWLKLEAELCSATGAIESRSVQLKRRWNMHDKHVWLAGAAVAVLLLILATWVFLPKHSHMSEHHQFTSEFGRYLEEFERDPESAQAILLELYEHDRIAANEVSERLGYRPATSKGLPEGYTPVSMQVLNMPCCTCVQTICRRSDGSTIALFEHDDEGTNEWFGDRPSTMESCSNKECQLVNLNDKLAATWKRGSRYITLIGVQDKSEIDTFINWLDKDATLDDG